MAPRSSRRVRSSRRPSEEEAEAEEEVEEEALRREGGPRADERAQAQAAQARQRRTRVGGRSPDQKGPASFFKDRSVHAYSSGAPLSLSLSLSRCSPSVSLTPVSSRLLGTLHSLVCENVVALARLRFALSIRCLLRVCLL